MGPVYSVNERLCVRKIKVAAKALVSASRPQPSEYTALERISWPRCRSIPSNLAVQSPSEKMLSAMNDLFSNRGDRSMGCPDT